MKDGKTGAIRGMVVPSKGPGEGQIVDRIVKIIDEAWGRKDIIIKSDREGAIESLKDKIRQRRESETKIEKSPKGESRSNGAAESAV
eukprot:12167761-Karenia_brevis.AAC.1